MTTYESAPLTARGRELGLQSNTLGAAIESVMLAAVHTKDNEGRLLGVSLNAVDIENAIVSLIGRSVRRIEMRAAYTRDGIEGVMEYLTPAGGPGCYVFGDE